jgi:hypothetical protein
VDFFERQDREQSSFLTVEMIRQRMERLIGADVEIITPQNGPPTAAPVNIEIVGEDFAVLSRLADEATAVTRMIRKYHDLPMSLADACLVRMCESHPGSVVFTLDADFRIYRSTARQPIPVWMPEE